jgi:hypothetical protein
LLKARVIIYAYDQHVWLLSPEPMVIDKPQSTRVEGASIVMKSSEVKLHFSVKALTRHLSSVGHSFVANPVDS